MDFVLKFYVKENLTIQEVEKCLKLIEKTLDETLVFSINPLGKPYSIMNREVFISSTFEKNIPLITNALEHKMVVFSGNFISYEIAKMWYVTLEIRKQVKKEDLSKLLKQLFSVFYCYWGKVTPSEHEGRFTRQSFSNYLPSSKKDLPKLPNIITFDSPYIPAKLGWINYWPAPALKRIGFKAHHRSLFHSVQDAANDGLILQITEEPLDFDIAEHLRKTVAIYDALPAIGGRDCV